MMALADTKIHFVAENRSALQFGVGQPAPDGPWFVYNRRVNFPWIMRNDAFPDEHEAAQWCRDVANGGLHAGRRSSLP